MMAIPLHLTPSLEKKEHSYDVTINKSVVDSANFHGNYPIFNLIKSKDLPFIFDAKTDWCPSSPFQLIILSIQKIVYNRNIEKILK